MVDDNAINPETGEIIYVGILQKLPEGFRWIHDLHTDDWLKIVRGLTSRALDAWRAAVLNGQVKPPCASNANR
jgi:hypothetical protein